MGTIYTGKSVKIDCVDFTGGLLGNNDSADDVKTASNFHVHYLNGSFEITTAKPGDLSVVDVQDVQLFQEHLFEANLSSAFLERN